MNVVTWTLLDFKYFNIHIYVTVWLTGLNIDLLTASVIREMPLVYATVYVVLCFGRLQ